MKKFSQLVIVLLLACNSQAQKENSISVAEVRRVETALASDDMSGRRVGTPGIERAAAFIANEFKKAGLQPIKDNSFLQEFSMVRSRPKSIKAEVDGKEF